MSAFLCSYIFMAAVAAAAAARNDLLADECVVNGLEERFVFFTFGDEVELLLSLDIQADTRVDIVSGGEICQIRVSRRAFQRRGEWLLARLNLTGRPSLTINGQPFGADGCSTITKHRKGISIRNAFVLKGCPQKQPNFHIPVVLPRSLEVPWFADQVNLTLLLQVKGKIPFSVGGNRLFLCKSSDGRVEVTETSGNCSDVESDTRIHLRVARSNGSFQIEVENRDPIEKEGQGDDVLKFTSAQAVGPVDLVQCLGKCREAEAGEAAGGAGCSPSYKSAFIGVTVVLVLVLLGLGVYVAIESKVLNM